MTQLSGFLQGNPELKKPLQRKAASEATNAAELGEAMPLVARKDALKLLYEMSYGQFKDWKNRDPGSCDLSKSILIPTCCGASGIGKSRFSSQAFYIIQEEMAKRPRHTDETLFQEALAGCVEKELVLEINITEGPLPEEGQAPMVSIGLRTLSAYCRRYR